MLAMKGLLLSMSSAIHLNVVLHNVHKKHSNCSRTPRMMPSIASHCAVIINGDFFFAERTVEPEIRLPLLISVNQKASV